MKTSGYSLSRGWFDFSFENPEKIRPIHTAIFFFAIEHCNRLGWKEKFGFPSAMVMEAIGVKKHQTYIRAFNDLVDWGFINIIQISKNQYSSNIISLECFNNALPKNGKALDKALSKHRAKQGQSTGQSKVHINKQINKRTNKQTNQKKTGKVYDPIFLKFYEIYPRKKSKADASRAWKKIDSPVETLKKIRAALEWQVKTEMWTKDNGQFIPYPSSYLNGRRWEDEPEKSAQKLLEEKYDY